MRDLGSGDGGVWMQIKKNRIAVLTINYRKEERRYAKWLVCVVAHRITWH
jgi:hypothetical protein